MSQTGALNIKIGKMVYLALLLLLAGNEGADLNKARKLYLEAVAGDRFAAQESEALLNRLTKSEPEDARIRAYLGSLKVLESGRTMALWKRGSLAKSGLEALDRAVSMSPEDAEVRFLRAVSTFHLPGFFHRDKQCLDDLQFVADRAEQMDRAFAAAAHYHYGLLMDKKGDHAAARTAWKLAVKAAPESRSGTEAARRLQQ